MGNHVIRDRVWASKKLGRCSLMAALAYPSIFLIADEWGRFEYRPYLIWSHVFGPRRDLTPDDVPTVEDVAKWLSEYEREELLVRYHIDGDLAFWTGFTGRPPSKRHASIYPAPEGLTSGRKSASKRGRRLERKNGEQELEQETRARDKRLEQEQQPEAVRQVFDAWREATGHSEAVFDEKRQTRIRSRLREGFSVQRLLLALEGWKADDWCQGRHPKNSKRYDGIETIFRDAAQVERLSAQAQPKPPPIYATETPEEAARRKLKKTGTE